jgi:hypothetical protein
MRPPLGPRSEPQSVVAPSGSAAIQPLAERRPIAVGATWLATLVGAIALGSVGLLGDGALFGSGFTLVFPGLAMDILAFGSVGAILSLRRPGNRVGLVLLVAAMLIALTFLGYIYGAVLTAYRGEDDVLAGFTTLLGALNLYPMLIIAGPMLALVLPDGHLPGPRWRWPVRAIAAAVALSLAVLVVRPGPIGDGLADNPLGLAGIAWLDALSRLATSLLAIAVPCSLLLALAGVAVRFRRSRGVERQQLKWFVAAFVAVVVFVLLAIADGATEPTLFDLLFVWSLALPPIAVGIAVLRYRLYEIDRIISRTLGWALVTGLFSTLFAGLVVGLQALFATVTGGNTLAVAASTLVVAVLFQPLRRRIQGGVDRRFNRARYDAQRTADAFAEQLRYEVDLTRLRVALADTVGEAVRPASATVWLRDRPR